MNDFERRLRKLEAMLPRRLSVKEKYDNIYTESLQFFLIAAVAHYLGKPPAGESIAEGLRLAFGLTPLEFEKVMDTGCLQKLLSPALDKLLAMFDISWGCDPDKFLNALDMMTLGLSDHYKRCLRASFKDTCRRHEGPTA